MFEFRKWKYSHQSETFLNLKIMRLSYFSPLQPTETWGIFLRSFSLPPTDYNAVTGATSTVCDTNIAALKRLSRKAVFSSRIF